MSSATRALRLGLVGCGWIMQYGHLRPALANPGVIVTGCLDPDPARARAMANRCPWAQAVTLMDDLLTLGCDAWVVASPNVFHEEHASVGVRHGVAVLCEKPFGTKTDAVREVAREAAERGVAYVPALVNRFRLDVDYLRRALAEGVVGQVREVRCGWLRRGGTPAPGSWFTSSRWSGGGVLTDLGSHMLDLALMIAGPERLQVSTARTGRSGGTTPGAAWYTGGSVDRVVVDTEDFAEVELVGETVRAKVTVAWECDLPADATYVHVVGSRGRLTLRTLFGFSPRPLWPEPTLVVASGQNIVRRIPRAGQAETAFQRQLNAFLAHIVRGPRSAVTDGRLASSAHGLTCVDLTAQAYAHAIAINRTPLPDQEVIPHAGA